LEKELVLMEHVRLSTRYLELPVEALETAMLDSIAIQGFRNAFFSRK